MYIDLKVIWLRESEENNNKKVFHQNLQFSSTEIMRTWWDENFFFLIDIMWKWTLLFSTVECVNWNGGRKQRTAFKCKGCFWLFRSISDIFRLAKYYFEKSPWNKITNIISHSENVRIGMKWKICIILNVKIFTFKFKCTFWICMGEVKWKCWPEM